MLSIKPTLIIDLISAFWVVMMVLLLFLWLPIKSIPITKVALAPLAWLGLWLRTILLLVIGVLALSYLNLLNWLSLIIVYTGCLLLNYGQQKPFPIKRVREIIQKKTIDLVDFLDQGISLADFMVKITNAMDRLRTKLVIYTVNLVTHQGIVFFVLLIGVLVFSCLLRTEYPLSGLRLTHPDRYQTLLITRQILAREYPTIEQLPIFPVLVATLSLLGSIEPMQAIRFLCPIIGIGLVISVGYVVRIVTNNLDAGLVAMLSLGIYLFTWKPINLESWVWLAHLIASLDNSLIRQWAGNEIELGAVFLLLGLVYYFGSDFQVRQTKVFKLNLLATIILVGISAPPLLILVLVGSIGLLGDKQITLSAITLTWILLAVFSAIAQERLLWLQSFLVTLPLALSLLAGLLFNAIANLARIFVPQGGHIFCLGLVFALSINFLLPLTPQITYLEYDLAARKSIEIKNLFPAKQWTLVAPVEQLAEIYGAGWYQDLALFVEQYGAKASRAEFDFPVLEGDLFIMVEKIPFVTFPNEPDTLPNNVLSDPTYLYYRSTAGRASLEYEALEMCEAYRQYHPQSEIYYEDRQLRIYRFMAT